MIKREKRRWLVFVGDRPATVERKTYAESLAQDLTAQGHVVVVARAQDGTTPRRSRGENCETTVLELDPGPIPAGARSHEILTRAAALHRGLDRIAQAQERFDVIVGEGARGALVAQPLAARQGVPFVFALERCEVERRSNRLTRDQLHGAEVEHWACDRASAVVTPRSETTEAVRAHYLTAEAWTVARPCRTRLEAPKEAERLLSRLGLERNSYVAVLAGDLDESTRRFLARLGEQGLVLGAGGIWSVKNGAAVGVSRNAAEGSVLAALLVGAQRTVALEPYDVRAVEARRLGCVVESNESGDETAHAVALEDVALEGAQSAAVKGE